MDLGKVLGVGLLALVVAKTSGCSRNSITQEKKAKERPAVAQAEKDLNAFTNFLSEVEKQRILDETAKLVSETLPGIFQEKQFVFVEYSTEYNDNTLKEITALLEGLKAEGLTHVTIDLPSNFKDFIDGLDYSLPDEKLKDQLNDAMSKYNIPSFWHLNFDLIISAKKKGLEVICTSSPFRADSTNYLARIHSEARDTTGKLKKVTKSGKALILFSMENGDQLSKKLLVRRERNTKHTYEPLAARLVKEYGDDSVATIESKLHQP